MESGWATGWKLTALPAKLWNSECSTRCCLRPAIGQIQAIPPVAASHSQTTSRLKDIILIFRLRGSGCGMSCGYSCRVDKTPTPSSMQFNKMCSKRHPKARVKPSRNGNNQQYHGTSEQTQHHLH